MNMWATDLLTDVTGSAVTFAASPANEAAVTVPAAVMFVPLIVPVVIVPVPRFISPLTVKV
jgi:hypothetical protein